MAAGQRAVDDQRRDLSYLLPLALSRPQEALSEARAVLGSHPDDYDASIARHAAAIVLRDRGDVAGAISELRMGVRLAHASGDADREADVRATLGVALAWRGRSGQGLAELDRAATQARGALRGRILYRRASVHHGLGRYDAALADLLRALPLLRRAGDKVWEARAITLRAEVYLAQGATARAGADYARAEQLFAATGQEYEYAMARHNRGLTAMAQGDLPAALAYLDEAGRRYAALDAANPDLAIDRCRALLAAGLASDALHEADAAAAGIRRHGGHAYKRAELVFAAATAALATGDPVAARERAEHARRMFRGQNRSLWAARSTLVLVQARYLTGDHTARLLRQADQLASRLASYRSDETPQAHLLAGRIALALRRRGDADRHLERAALSRRRGSPLSRSVGWIAQAVRAQAHGDRRALLSACRRGLDILDEHRLTLGATELRAHATAHGAELAAIAQREVLRRGDLRRLLQWTERWRATVQALPRVTPPHDPDLVAELSALREASRRLEDNHTTRAAHTVLQRERRRLENSVRARVFRTTGTATRDVPRLDVDRLFATLGDTLLVELIEIDGILHVLTAADRKLRLHTVGKTPGREVDRARFLLRRLAYGGAAGTETVVDQVGRRLEDCLLGPAAAGFGDRPVVLVPPGRLHAVPWALLPSLRDRAVSVAPSAATWLRAVHTEPPRRRDVTLVVGPGLGTGGAEVPLLADRYPGATVLGDGTATAERVLTSLDGAWLAHIASHGTFRADNPLFSALGLDDGPLTVHDLERLRRAPYRLILSSCDSGAVAPVGADELLGLVSSLEPMGAAGIAASVVQVNDAAVVPLMLALHDALRTGATLPEALLTARTRTADDPVSAATGLAFIALGI
jgi:CHAT domain-containing protein/tetratricopeptide (TPR) repeat protein